MAELKEYTVEIEGVPHTMLLSEADAAKRGLIDPDAGPIVDVEAVVEARVAEIRADLETEHETRVAAIEAEHAARAQALEQEFETRLETALAEAAAAAPEPGGAADPEKPKRQRSPKAGEGDPATK
ncbi:hypothetical protein Leucomu_13485 [Leucobacter muris]|uniref:Uncharacterized protein n=1 Tax=Leucobacter muris TaxID=1935379 RepID=A0ABX5QI64_9MICO|nr:hypothetical protein [Leucobacter muris]QAB18786.1 hypothetical protein Leucomu_13485 [Leucobacter muris]